jgi:hypothetical protein
MLPGEEPRVIVPRHSLHLFRTEFLRNGSHYQRFRLPNHTLDRLRAASILATRIGHLDTAVRLNGRAETLRQRFEETFWSDELGSYACSRWMVGSGRARSGRRMRDSVSSRASCRRIAPRSCTLLASDSAVVPS